MTIKASAPYQHIKLFRLDGVWLKVFCAQYLLPKKHHKEQSDTANCNTSILGLQSTFSQNAPSLSASKLHYITAGVLPPFCCLSLILLNNHVMVLASVFLASSSTTKGTSEEPSLSEMDKLFCIFPDPCPGYRRENIQLNKKHSWIKQTQTEGLSNIWATSMDISVQLTTGPLELHIQIDYMNYIFEPVNYF